MGVRWTHIAITVSDLDRSIDFYRSACGLEVVRDRRLEGGSTVWMGYERGAGELPDYVLVLLLGEVTSRLDHFGFQCDTREEVDAIARVGQRRGILAHPPTDAGGTVGYFAMLSDPDGHTVEFTFGQPIRGLG
jgi:catechol 2,3-dioxygenase-like lactoylglutathione lyase family enzyme